MTATARVIWLCACARYCRPRGWCLSVSVAFFRLLYSLNTISAAHSKTDKKLVKNKAFKNAVSDFMQIIMRASKWGKYGDKDVEP